MAALYRRYRPESFFEVIGQSHVTTPLMSALLAGRTNHAYLFSGPRGCGKTTSARILARCLNCAEGPTDTPCGACPSCVELSRDGGGSLDVVEIDAASHNGVDDARELRERAVFAPARDRYKIYILDEAHMVTQQGFNALLKIVEEPPEHVKFIFATTEPEKVIPTIRSRTHHYPFRLVPANELLEYLEHVAESEGISVEAGVLPLVVRSGGGSVRDSMSILDQLIAGSNGSTLTLDSAQNLLGFTPRAVLDEVIAAISNRDSRAVFVAVDRVIQAGQDPRRFVEDLLSHLRDVIVVQAASAEASSLFPGVSGADIQTWQEQATWFEPQVLSEMARSVNHALKEMSGVTSPKLQLELLMATLLTFSEGSQIPKSIEQSDSSDSEALPEGHNIANSEALKDQAEEKSQGEPHERVDTEPAARQLVSWNIHSLVEAWPGIIAALADHKRSLWVAMSETKPIEIDGDVITIGFPRKSDAEILRKPQGPGSPLPNADLLRELILTRTGHTARFTVAELASVPLAPEAQEPANSEWPEVSKPQGEETETEPANSEAAIVEETEALTEDAATPIVATRGEPVVRQLLGGELVAEEILESMTDQGEGDV